jgi:paraquat-inducible protein B
MSRQANPTLVGAFVVGGITLGVVAMFLLGARTLFHKTHPFIMYFHGDVNGLSVGSAVKFQGVPIGEVTAIKLRITPEGATTIIPVKILLDEDVVEQASDTEISLSQERYKRAIEKGLRARLETESLVTGQRYVSLLIDPDQPAELLALTPGIDEIPTVPATTEEVMKLFDQLKGMKIAETFADLSETVKSLRELAASPELKAVPGSLKAALAGIEQTLATIRGSFNNADGVLAALQKALENVLTVEAELEKTLQSSQAVMDPRSPLLVQLQATLQEFGATARSLRTLSDALERDPSALLRGRDIPEKP